MGPSTTPLALSAASEVAMPGIAASPPRASRASIAAAAWLSPSASRSTAAISRVTVSKPSLSSLLAAAMAPTSVSIAAGATIGITSVRPR
jgi:hypothetical protein